MPTLSPIFIEYWVGRIDATQHFFNHCLHSPSASTSLTISCSSSSVGCWSRLLITVPSSLVVIFPSPSLSKRANASLYSTKQSSVFYRLVFLYFIKFNVIYIPLFDNHTDSSTDVKTSVKHTVTTAMTLLYPQLFCFVFLFFTDTLTNFPDLPANWSGVRQFA